MKAAKAWAGGIGAGLTAAAVMLPEPWRWPCAALAVGLTAFSVYQLPK